MSVILVVTQLSIHKFIEHKLFLEYISLQYSGWYAWLRTLPFVLKIVRILIFVSLFPKMYRWLVRIPAFIAMQGGFWRVCCLNDYYLHSGKLKVVPLYTSNDSYSNIIHLHVHVPVIMKRGANNFLEVTVIRLNFCFCHSKWYGYFNNGLKKWLGRCECVNPFYKHNTFREKIFYQQCL